MQSEHLVRARCSFPKCIPVQALKLDIHQASCVVQRTAQFPTGLHLLNTRYLFYLLFCRPLHAPSGDPVEDSSAVQHFHDKLLRIRERLKTEPGKQLAVKRHKLASTSFLSCQDSILIILRRCWISCRPLTMNSISSLSRYDAQRIIGYVSSGPYIELNYRRQVH